MSVIIANRFQGVSGTADVDKYGLPLTGFKISGLDSANVIGVCNYDYDYSSGKWCPRRWDRT